MSGLEDFKLGGRHNAGDPEGRRVMTNEPSPLATEERMRKAKIPQYVNDALCDYIIQAYPSKYAPLVAAIAKALDEAVAKRATDAWMPEHLPATIKAEPASDVEACWNWLDAEGNEMAHRCRDLLRQLDGYRADAERYRAFVVGNKATADAIADAHIAAIDEARERT